jgi:hypothetical protein
LQVGPAIALISSEAARSKTAHVVIYAADSIAHDVLKTVSSAYKTALCTWFLGGIDIEAKDCLKLGILSSCQVEAEEESIEKIR